MLTTILDVYQKTGNSRTVSISLEKIASSADEGLHPHYRVKNIQITEYKTLESAQDAFKRQKGKSASYEEQISERMLKDDKSIKDRWS